MPKEIEEDKLKREEEKEKLKKVKIPQVLQASQAYIVHTARTAALRTACIMSEIMSMLNLRRPIYNHI